MRAISLFLSAATLVAAAAPAEAAQRHRFDLPGGRLGPVLVLLGEQAGISIGVSDPALTAIRVPALRGTFTVEEALRRLLRGTRARAVFLDPTTVRISRAAPPPVRRRTPRPPPPRPAPRPPAPVERALPPAEPVEIVITATKRRVPIEAYPGPVSIVTGEDAALRHGVAGTDALVGRLPSLTSTHLGAGRNKLFIRGIADSSFTGPTQATVGQYLDETRINLIGPDPDLRLLDLDRVEVLAGPQGTLYGSGSIGGIIRIVPNAPRMDALEARASLGASHTAHGEPGADASAVLNVPLAGRTALRLLGYGASEGGYIDDLYRGLSDVNRTTVQGVRASLRALVAADWTIDLGATAQRTRGDDAQYARRGGPPLTRSTGTAQAFGNDYLLGQLIAAREWDRYRFVTSIGGVRQRLRERYDFSILREGLEPVIVDETQRVRLLSVETRLSRQQTAGSGWIVGIGLVKNRSFQRDLIGSIQAPQEFARFENLFTEAAAFGEATVRLGGDMRATVGGRFSHSRLSGPEPESVGSIPDAGAPKPPEESAPPGKVERVQNLFLPSFGLSAELAPELLLFARYQQAFRPGGFAYSGETLKLFRSDRVAGLEAGVRYGQAGAGRFDASLSAVYTRWKDIQADVSTSIGRISTGNVGDGRIYTLDLRLGWRPLRRMSLEAAAVLNDSRVTDPVQLGFGGAPIERSALPNVAKVHGRLGAEYRPYLSDRFDVRLFGSLRYVGKSILGIGPVLGREQGDWADLSLGASAGFERHLVTLGISNLLDVRGNRFAFGSAYTFHRDEQITPLRPRTVRLGYEISF